jgi:hypothetical protein
MTTISLHALPGHTAAAYFRSTPGFCTTLRHPDIYTSTEDVLSVEVAGVPVKVVMTEDRSLVLPFIKLEAQQVKVTLRGAGPVGAPIAAPATLPSTPPRSARRRPPEPSYGLSPRGGR